MNSKDINMGGGNKLPIKQFSLNQMVQDPAIIMIAKRGSGKSVVTKAIMHHFKHIPAGLVIAPTDRMNSFYGDFFPSSYIYYDYKSEVIEKLLARQIEIIEKYKKAKMKGKKINPHSFIVMDDCLSQKKTWAKDQPIQELLYNGRHYKIMYILTMQYPLGISPDLRSNFDYVFMLAEDTVSNLKRYYEHYAGMFPTFDSFRQVFNQLTKDFGCMVIANRGARESFLEKIYWYKAPMLDNNFKIGCNQFNNYHSRNFNKDWNRKFKPFDSKIFDFNEFVKKKKNDHALIQVDRVEEN
jgi:hypothetical protein